MHPHRCHGRGAQRGVRLLAGASPAIASPQPIATRRTSHAHRSLYPVQPLASTRHAAPWRICHPPRRGTVTDMP
jgi:hypothetical protein